jgi:hypothetical protein
MRVKQPPSVLDPLRGRRLPGLFSVSRHLVAAIGRKPTPNRDTGLGRGVVQWLTPDAGASIRPESSHKDKLRHRSQAAVAEFVREREWIGRWC